MDMTQIGRWAFLLGLILAFLAAFTTIPNLATVLFVLGLIAGFLNIQEKESTPFLVAIIAILVIGFSGLQLGGVTGFITNVLNNFIAFASAAALVVAIKQVVGLTKK